jgi:hypothetical protein
MRESFYRTLRELRRIAEYCERRWASCLDNAPGTTKTMRRWWYTVALVAWDKWRQHIQQHGCNVWKSGMSKLDMDSSQNGWAGGGKQ